MMPKGKKPAPDLDDRELTVTDVANMRGVARSTARRLLRKIADEHGPSVVATRGRRLVTTRKALARFMPDIGENDLDLRATVLRLTKRIDDMQAEIDALIDWRRKTSKQLQAPPLKP